MRKIGGPEEEKSGSRGPMMLYLLVAMIVGLFLLFLVLRPRGASAGPPQKVEARVVGAVVCG